MKKGLLLLKTMLFSILFSAITAIAILLVLVILSTDIGKLILHSMEGTIIEFIAAIIGIIGFVVWRLEILRKKFVDTYNINTGIFILCTQVPALVMSGVFGVYCDFMARNHWSSELFEGLIELIFFFTWHGSAMFIALATVILAVCRLRNRKREKMTGSYGGQNDFN